MKKLFSENLISFLFRIIATILVIIPVIYTVGRMSIIPEYKKTLVFILLAVLTEILTIIFDRKFWCDFIHVAGAVFMALAFASFLSGGVLSIADYIAGINLFGDATQVPAIVTYSIILFCGMLLSIVDCFVYKGAPKPLKNQIKIIKEKE
ncbi:MAG: hypothetical protein HDR71_10330 [Lachnospiraceae bacterium]|nr:hypothetical protein [Lachnospiraceae bacterium]